MEPCIEVARAPGPSLLSLPTELIYHIFRLCLASSNEGNDENSSSTQFYHFNRRTCSVQHRTSTLDLALICHYLHDIGRVMMLETVHCHRQEQFQAFMRAISQDPTRTRLVREFRLDNNPSLEPVYQTTPTLHLCSNIRKLHLEDLYISAILQALPLLGNNLFPQLELCELVRKKALYLVDTKPCGAWLSVNLLRRLFICRKLKVLTLRRINLVPNDDLPRGSTARLSSNAIQAQSQEPQNLLPALRCLRLYQSYFCHACYEVLLSARAINRLESLDGCWEVAYCLSPPSTFESSLSGLSIRHPGFRTKDSLDLRNFRTLKYVKLPWRHVLLNPKSLQLGLPETLDHICLLADEDDNKQILCRVLRSFWNRPAYYFPSLHFLEVICLVGGPASPGCIWQRRQLHGINETGHTWAEKFYYTRFARAETNKQLREMAGGKTKGEQKQARKVSKKKTKKENTEAPFRFEFVIEEILLDPGSSPVTA
jgi:hypothetical protein